MCSRNVVEEDGMLFSYCVVLPNLVPNREGSSGIALRIISRRIDSSAFLFNRSALSFFCRNRPIRKTTKRKANVATHDP